MDTLLGICTLPYLLHIPYFNRRYLMQGTQYVSYSRLLLLYSTLTLLHHFITSSPTYLRYITT